jgi:hypothetical protein
MGYSAAAASRVLRCSSGWETGEREWDELLEALSNCVSGKLREQQHLELVVAKESSSD